MKKSLKYKIVLAIVIIVCIMDVSFIFVNYVNYMNVNRNYTDSLAQTVANTCRLVVDGRQRNGLSGQQTEKYGVLRGME